jgi:hypothetical protein
VVYPDIPERRAIMSMSRRAWLAGGVAFTAGLAARAAAAAKPAVTVYRSPT